MVIEIGELLHDVLDMAIVWFSIAFVLGKCGE